jgi:hypothetical protein
VKVKDLPSAKDPWGNTRVAIIRDSKNDSSVIPRKHVIFELDSARRVGEPSITSRKRSLYQSMAYPTLISCLRLLRRALFASVRATGRRL